jgi:Leucine-rich repeat (LRR) protein
LKELDLSINSFSGDFPIELFNLINLEQLSLNQNEMNITQLSTNLGSMLKLKTLRMEQCGLMGSIPIEIGFLTNLVTLSFHGNKVTGSIPNSIGSAINLLYVDFSNNMLQGKISTELGLLSSIKIFDVSENGLTGSIPVELSRLTAFQFELDLSNNKLTGSIPKEICIQSCCAMASVNVNGNNVETCDPKLPCVDCAIQGNDISSKALRNFMMPLNYSWP